MGENYRRLAAAFTSWFAGVDALSDSSIVLTLSDAGPEKTNKREIT